MESPGLAACDVAADQSYAAADQQQIDRGAIKAMTTEYWELTGRARTLRGQLESLGVDPQEAGKDMQQPKSRGGVHAKAETILDMVRAGDFDALQEYVFCKEGADYHAWGKGRKQRFQKGKGKK